MSNNNNNEIYGSFEDSIREKLTGDSLTNALDFAAYVKENGMTTKGEHGEVSYMEKALCYTYIDGSERMPGPWTVWTEGNYSVENRAVPMDAGMKEIAWANVNYCGNCGNACSPGKTATILGKDFENVCSAVMVFTDPDADTMQCVKKLMDMRKHAIFNGAASTNIEIIH